MIQLILHLIGDFLTQSDWMAQNKTKASWPALCHATVYSLPFLLIGSPLAVFVIGSTHFLIDRFRLVRYVIWAKNHLSPVRTMRMERKLVPGVQPYTHVPVTYPSEKLWWRPWAECSVTGYPPETSEWLAVWLMVVADNTLHLLVNWLALRHF